jgi:hypothetical protein
MRRALLVGVVLLAACRKAPPAAPAPPRCETATLIARQATDPMELDGELLEPTWLAAKSTGAFANVVDGGPIAPHTELRATWTTDALHLAIYAADEDLTELDAVAIRLENGAGVPVTLEVTPKNTLRCAGCMLPEGAKLAVDVDEGTFDDRSDEDEEWVAELQLPWKGLGYSRAPQSLRLNAWRTDVPKGARARTLSWVPRCNGAPGWGQVTLVQAVDAGS